MKHALFVMVFAVSCPAQDAKDTEIAEARKNAEAVRRELGDHEQTKSALNRLGVLLFKAKRYKEALVVMRDLLAMSEKLHGADHPETAFARNQVGAQFYGLGDWQTAEGHYRRALETFEKHREHEHFPSTLKFLGLTLARQGRFTPAEELLRRLVEIRVKSVGEHHADTSMAVYHLAELLFQQGRYAEAVPHWERVLRIEEKLYGPRIRRPRRRSTTSRSW